MIKKWTVTDKTNTVKTEINIYGDRIAFEFIELQNQNLRDDLLYLLETRDFITRNDLNEYFDQNFEVDISVFLKVCDEIVSEIRKDDG